MTKNEQTAEGIGRRALIGGGAALLAAVGTSATGIRSAAAQPAAVPNPGGEELNAEHAKAMAEKVSPEAVKAMETWGGSLALQAVTYAAPLVAMYNLRSTVAVGPNPKAPPGQIWRQPNISTPKLAQEAGYVTPNVNVVYGFGFADLGREPYILSAPDSDGRYYMIEIVDMWTNAFAYPAGEIAGYKGGKFALVGPAWKGELPAGVTRIDCPTRWIELQPRVHVKDEADLPGAQKVLNAISLQGLSEYTGGPAMKAPVYDYKVPEVNPKIASSQMQFDDPMQFWSIFAAAMNENPPPEDQIKSAVPQYKYLGIEFGKPFDPKGVNPIFLGAMKRAVEEFGHMMNQSTPLIGTLKNGWAIPPADQGNSGPDYMARAIIAVIGLTANTAQEAIYYPGVVDNKGVPLTGEKRYAITFREGMLPIDVVPPGFWSVTMYDGVTRYTVPNPINRYFLGSDNDLKKNADGSFTMYVQHESPGPDKESNWLPAPAGPYYLMLRNYAPVPKVGEALKDPATFQAPPLIVPVG